MEFKISGGAPNATIAIENRREENGIFYFDVSVTYEQETVPAPFRIRFQYPGPECYSVWSPSVRLGRQLMPNWRKQTTNSRLASWMPLHAVLSATGRNRMTIAISDALTPTSIGTGVIESDADLECVITFFTIQVAPLKEYRATVRIDWRDIPYYDSIYDAVTWWETDCGYTPAHVPEEARLPMNSLWYSYHQELDVEDIIKECALSKPLGMDTVIIDDGWQTDDNSRGYAYCGDWEVAESKIPDMKDFIDRIHGTGMKVMLWYSVPFVGIYSKNYDKFKDMLLDETGRPGKWSSVDPRYPEVRKFLIDTYARTLTEWGLDGLKLDFIDSFALRGKSLEYDERRDYQSLEDAIDRLMTDVTDTLQKINPDVMIEFRQSYVGPAIRKYGNMLRVGDCPNDALLNRQDVVNLRLTSGRTAVHSDMLMWNYGDTVESAALQFASILYSVPQISVKIAKLTEEHKKMLGYYLAFWREHRETLLDGKILAANPESDYSLVCSEKDGKAIFTAYTDPVIDCTGYGEAVAVNATRYGRLILKNAAGRTYRSVNCMGEPVAEGTVEGTLCEVDVPLSGMVFVQ